MSNKYQKVMNRVNVTDEMRSRLLVRIADADLDAERGRFKEIDDKDLGDAFSGRKIRRFRTQSILAGLAAACAIIIGVGLFAATTGVKTTGTHETAAYGEAAAHDEAEETAEYALVEGAKNGMEETVGAPGTEAYDAGTEDAVGNAAQAGRMNLPESAIRETVGKYIGEDYYVLDVTEDENILTYSIAQTDKTDVVQRIRIDRTNGSVSVSEVSTGETRELTYSEMNRLAAEE